MVRGLDTLQANEAPAPRNPGELVLKPIFSSLSNSSQVFETSFLAILRCGRVARQTPDLPSNHTVPRLPTRNNLPVPPKQPKEMVNAFVLANKYTALRADEITKLSDEFSHVDRNNAGSIEKRDVKSVLDVLDEKLAQVDITAKLAELKLKDPSGFERHGLCSLWDHPLIPRSRPQPKSNSKRSSR